jgi:hypothetical protein
LSAKKLKEDELETNLVAQAGVTNSKLSKLPLDGDNVRLDSSSFVLVRFGFTGQRDDGT